MDQDTDCSPTLFDARMLRSRLMGDDELVDQVLQACVPEMNANMRDYVEAVESGQMVRATTCIHAMKGASQNADLKAVSLLTARIESSLRSGEIDFAFDSLERLEEMVGATICEVRQFLDR